MKDPPSLEDQDFAKVGDDAKQNLSTETEQHQSDAKEIAAGTAAITDQVHAAPSMILCRVEESAKVEKRPVTRLAAEIILVHQDEEVEAGSGAQGGLLSMDLCKLLPLLLCKSGIAETSGRSILEVCFGCTRSYVPPLRLQ